MKRDAVQQSDVRFVWTICSECSSSPAVVAISRLVQAQLGVALLDSAVQVALIQGEHVLPHSWQCQRRVALDVLCAVDEHDREAVEGQSALIQQVHHASCRAHHDSHVVVDELMSLLSSLDVTRESLDEGVGMEVETTTGLDEVEAAESGGAQDEEEGTGVGRRRRRSTQRLLPLWNHATEVAR